MRAWQFDQAAALLRNAGEILDQRAAIAAAAASSGLTLPDTLQTAFEAPDGFASATLEARAELEAIERYDTAAASRLGDPDMVEALGLWGTTPEVDLDLARTLFAAGDLAGSAEAADSAASTWASAQEVGRGRIVSLIVLAVALLMAIVLLAFWLRGRRRGATGATEPMGAAGAEPYATLGPSWNPTEPVEATGDRPRGAEPD